MDPEKVYDRQLAIARLLFFNFASALVIYGFIVHKILPAAVQANPAPPQRVLFYGLSALLAVGVWMAPRVFIQKVLPTPLPQLGQKVLTFHIFTYALAEAPAVFGLILAYSSHEKSDFYRLAVWSMVLLVLVFPKKEFWRQVASCARQKD